MKHGPGCTCIPCVSAGRRRGLEQRRQDEELRILRKQLVPFETQGAGSDGDR